MTMLAATHVQVLLRQLVRQPELSAVHVDQLLEQLLVHDRARRQLESLVHDVVAQQLDHVRDVSEGKYAPEKYELKNSY